MLWVNRHVRAWLGGTKLVRESLDESAEAAEEGSVERFREDVRDHVGRGDVMEEDFTGFDAFFDGEVADVDVF